MGDNTEIRVKFEIGDIKFEAEGSADLVERERTIFTNTLLPSAVEAIVRTRGAIPPAQYIEASAHPAMLLPAGDVTTSENPPPTALTADLSRTSLSSFLISYGTLSEQDFTLIAAYYDEKKNGTKSFSSESVKQYYNDARRQKYSNVSELLKQLTLKGFIMDSPDAEKKIPKPYILTDAGIRYVDAYQPKENGTEKTKTAKMRKSKSKHVSIYSTLCADDLNLDQYPEIKSQNTFKNQMILTMYIVTKEGKGDSFSVADIQYLLTDMLGLPASVDQINGILQKNRSWFKSEQDPDNKKAYKRKLLQGAKGYAQSIINGIVE